MVKQGKKGFLFIQKNMLTKNISRKQILFSDETIIDICSYIKIFFWIQRKIRKKKKENLNLIVKEEIIFELAIWIAGGICSRG